MNGYTPTTDEVRDSIVYLNKYHVKQHGDVDLMVVGSETAAQFDRMIAEVKRTAIQSAAKWFYNREYDGTRHTSKSFIKYLLHFADQGQDVQDLTDLYVYRYEDVRALERAAAEKAWDECLTQMPMDLDWKIQYGDQNPYRSGVK